MITSKLDGGLGNLLFEISAGYAHAKRINSTFFLMEDDENYETGYFSFVKNKISKEYAEKIVSSWTKYKDTVFSKIPVRKKEDFEVVKQGGFKYSPLPPRDNVILDGYFQSEKYFNDFENEIKNLFVFTESLKKRNLRKLNNLKKKKVGVHFRRYKYNHAILPPMPWVYYDIAMKSFNSNDYEFVLFSDDIDEVAKNMDMKRFNHLENETDVDDLFTLSQCDAIIMSNSTFSWWGSWLGKKKEKVIVPPFWCGIAGPQDLQDLIPDRWDVLT